MVHLTIFVHPSFLSSTCYVTGVPFVELEWYFSLSLVHPSQMFIKFDSGQLSAPFNMVCPCLLQPNEVLKNFASSRNTDVPNSRSGDFVNCCNKDISLSFRLPLSLLVSVSTLHPLLFSSCHYHYRQYYPNPKRTWPHCVGQQSDLRCAHPIQPDGGVCAREQRAESREGGGPLRHVRHHGRAAARQARGTECLGRYRDWHREMRTVVKTVPHKC